MRKTFGGLPFAATFGAMVLPLAMTGGARAQETLAGVSAGTAAAAGLGAMGATVAMNAGQNARDNIPGQAGGGMIPDETGLGGGFGGPGAPGFPNVSVTTTVQRTQSQSWTRRTGDQYISELLNARAPRAPRMTTAQRRARARAEAAQARRFARMTPAQRRRVLAARYRKPPVGYLSYYLPQDRYKLTSGIWRFVTIEDDQRAYPVRYYYRPWSSSMIRLLSTPVRGVRRYNRVIGFRTWQDAMLAGYVPDPVTKPEPGAQIANIARMNRGPALARYVEFVYSGQVSPQVFDANYNYIQEVRRAVVSQRHTRPLLGRTIGQVMAAIMGEGQLPRYVGGTPRPPATAQGFPPGMGGPGFGGPPSGFSGPPPGVGGPPPGAFPGSAPGSQDQRVDDFNRFRNNAANLRR